MSKTSGTTTPAAPAASPWADPVDTPTTVALYTLSAASAQKLSQKLLISVETSYNASERLSQSGAPMANEVEIAGMASRADAGRD